jgi:hypothetical protein
VREEFLPWLEEAYPELVPDYRRLYRGSNAPRPVREAIANQVQTEKQRHPTFTTPTTPRTARRVPGPPSRAARREGAPSRDAPRDASGRESSGREPPGRESPAEGSESATQLSLILG